MWLAVQSLFSVNFQTIILWEIVISNVNNISRMFSKQATICRRLFKGYISGSLKQAIVTHVQPHRLQMIEVIQNAVILTTELSLLRGAACFTFCLQNPQMHVACLRHDSSDQNTEIMTQLSRQQCAGSVQTHIYSGWSCQRLSLTNKKEPSIRPRKVLVRVGLRLCSPLLEFTGERVFKQAQFAVYFRNTSESN